MMCLDYLRSGGTLVVPSLDRLGPLYPRPDPVSARASSMVAWSVGL